MARRSAEIVRADGKPGRPGGLETHFGTLRPSRRYSTVRTVQCQS
ncbi:hypothetical protein B005_0289 [Nocardiopsis alba ATCC BAA-2165]|uniref:Uncharacterized protein n=1 Tax=Nocardiopsis alba (strain ATCC BAA-2165 / BE74) TaxID=1205910 RepID=J7LAP4_NOCAA|nr:hypothetical protein B005_0289 [Nocardiopsis alba ATCC BAA-2165]